MAKLKHTLAASTAPAPAIDLAAAAKQRSVIARFVEAFIAAIRAMFAFVFGGTVETFRRDLSGIRKAAGVAKSVGDHALVAAGKGLEGPGRVLDAAAGAVGSTLGALLPVAPVGPRQVADAAVAHDRAPTMPAVFTAPAAPLNAGGRSEDDARNLQAWARCARKNDLAGAQKLPGINLAVFNWLNTLDDTQLLRLEQLPASRVLAHVLATTDADRTPLLPPAHGILSLSAGPTPEAVMNRLRVAPEDRPAILSRVRERRAAREEAYQPQPVFSL